jgi:hypothetical protein
MIKTLFAQHGSTLFLKLVIFLIGMVIIALFIFGLPAITKEVLENFSSFVYLPFLIGSYSAAIPFFIALIQSLKILSYVDNNKVFSQDSVKSLRNIKYSATMVGVLMMFCLPLVYQAAQLDDAPGLMVIGLVFTSTPLVIATAVAVMQKLLQNAVDIKSENDLTV